MVALRKESVDRNVHRVNATVGAAMSLSARRAWIEMLTGPDNYTKAIRSLSARRAWIEMAKDPISSTSDICRSPQGERG